MEKIVLIACASKKLNHKAKAKDLYVSPLFKYNLKYAHSIKPNKIFILSAKYGLVDLNEEIMPYNKTLNKMSKIEKEEWSKKVLNQLSEKMNLEKDEIIFFAGNNYRQYLIPFIKNYKILFKGLGIGKQLKYLKEKLKNE